MSTPPLEAQRGRVPGAHQRSIRGNQNDRAPPVPHLPDLRPAGGKVRIQVEGHRVPPLVVADLEDRGRVDDTALATTMSRDPRTTTLWQAKLRGALLDEILR